MRKVSRRDVIAAAGGFAVGATAAAAGGRILASLPTPRLSEWGPDASIWDKVPVREFALTTAPRVHPAISGTAAHQRLQVQAIGTAEEVYIRAQWEDAGKHDRILSPTDFSDAVAVEFPRNRDPRTSPMMGSQGAPVSIWQWMTSSGKASNLVAQGWGTIVPAPAQDVEAVGQYKQGRWVVTFRRNRKPQDDDSVDLTGISVIPAAFALWEGGNQETGGLKAVSVEAVQGRWIELEFLEV